MTSLDEDLLQRVRSAVALAKRGTWTDEAIRANEAVLDLDPDNVDALLRLLRCRMYRSEYLAANAVVDRLDALELEDSDRALVERHRQEAMAGADEERERARSEEAARRERNELLASAREVSSAREALALADAYRDTDDTEMVIALLERGRDVATTSEEMLSVLARLARNYRDVGNMTAALETYEHAIEIEPSYERNRVVYTSLTATLRRLGRFDDARQHGEALVDHFPDDPYVLNALGVVFVKLSVRDGDVNLAARAEDCFARAAAQAPDTRDSRKNLCDLAQALAELSDMLARAGDQASVDAVEAQRERIGRHLERLGVPS